MQPIHIANALQVAAPPHNNAVETGSPTKSLFSAMPASAANEMNIQMARRSAKCPSGEFLNQVNQL
jgi:hypothetical protein